MVISLHSYIQQLHKMLPFEIFRKKRWYREKYARLVIGYWYPLGNIDAGLLNEPLFTADFKNDHLQAIMIHKA